MGEKRLKNREVKKKKKVDSTSTSSVVIKSIVTQTQPELISKSKKLK